ncbi:MAG TPA: hypothetical protein VMM12_09795 [Longimicrobiales bacterium]|nr:hypothetical protein [Longimicrobiales bacterium]
MKVVAGVLVVALLAVGSVLMYRTYDYVQHDNQFCLECHLMRDPFERFAGSAHRGLGCKACHRPNIVQRSQMGLAQVIENPDSIRVHAMVPNEVCAECHIEGDPEEWVRVANTAGHRIHFESDEPSLQGLNCVECHSSGVHQFTPTDQTCGQGGCHESVEIRLGEMADLTIHCATCHDFAAPARDAPGTAEAAAALRPEAAQCLSCHQMRSMLANLPPDEPHQAECGACHNPHEQTTPRQAVQSCASAGCHGRPDTLTSYHRGLDPGVLEDCLVCHSAHVFRIHPETGCLDCHGDIYDDARPARPVSGGGPARLVPTGHPGTAAARAATGPVRLAAAGPLDRLARAAHAVDGTQDTAAFRHAQHRGVECTACHSTTRTHGGLTVTSLADCRACHHTAPVATPCAGCHTPGEVARLSARVRRTLDIRIGRLNRPTRMLPFDHRPHVQLDCVQCHTQGLALSAAAVDCAACHREHHEPDRSCMACHAQPREGAHDAQVHLGCAGSGCHAAVPASVDAVPRTRDFCLACHQNLTEHRPGRNCENCHSLPQPRSAAAPRSGGSVNGGTQP